MFKLIKNSLRSVPMLLWVILGIAFIVRLIGILYGLPLQLNIDEPSLVSGALKLKQGPNLQRFDWPHLYFYMNGAIYFVYASLRKFLSLFIELPELFYSSASFFLLSRLMSAVFGALTIIPIYYIGTKLFNKKVGYISALILTFMPIHVYESHLAKIDTGHTFFIAIVVYLIVQIFLTGKQKYYVWAGIFIGISISIKYNAFLLFLPLLIAHLLRRENLRDYFDIQGIKNLSISGVLAILFFFLGTPFALLDYDRFLSTERAVGVLWQFQNVGSVTWMEYPAELYETLIPMFRDNLGFFIWVLFMVLMFLFLFFCKRPKSLVLLLLPTIIFIFYFSRFGRSPAHYFLMLIPLYVPAIAAFIYEIWDWLSNKKIFIWLTLPLFVLIILLPSIIDVVKIDYLLARKDTRNMAFDWVRNNLDENNDFLFVVGEDLESIPFKKNETRRIKKLDRSNLDGQETPFYVVIGERNITKESIAGGNRDPDNLAGNSAPILKNAELLFDQDNIGRHGPPIYIFRVDKVISAYEEREANNDEDNSSDTETDSEADDDESDSVLSD